MENFETLHLSQPLPHVLQVQLHRPQARNALNTQMGRDLRALFGPLKFTPGDWRCVVITGEGDKAFCAGGDLKERQGMSDRDWQLQHAIFEEAYYAVLDCSVPVIAAVNGAAFGGGCELALMCDFIYAADHARFALPEVGLGIIPGCGGTQTLARAVGERRAKELVLTGIPFDAYQAQLWGMVNQVCPAGQLLSTALACAQRMADNAPLSVRQAKKAIHQGLQGDLQSGLNYEVAAYLPLIHTQDRREGTLAFNEKRKPRFTGA